MKERGILFSAPMVRALLAGSKTQTRRICKVRDVNGAPLTSYMGDALAALIRQHCLYGQPGDRLWVRETWQRDPLNDGKFLYRATQRCETVFDKWIPSIHMFRYASRITLEVTGVRVERLRDISETDAKAEGTTPSIVGDDLEHLKYRAGYQTLWESINGAGSWAANPWVWVVEFKKVTN
jgi:hypothetical protein